LEKDNYDSLKNLLSNQFDTLQSYLLFLKNFAPSISNIDLKALKNKHRKDFEKVTQFLFF